MEHPMFPRLMSLAFLAALSVPGLCQSAPYNVNFNEMPIPPATKPISVNFDDVVNVFGLDVMKLLSQGGNLSLVHGRSEFAFMRNWDGDSTLSSNVGLTPSTKLQTPFTGVTVSLNSGNPSYILQLGSPVLTEWELLADNGAFVIEASQLSYTKRQLISINQR